MKGRNEILIAVGLVVLVWWLQSQAGFVATGDLAASTMAASYNPFLVPGTAAFTPTVPDPLQALQQGGC